MYFLLCELFVLKIPGEKELSLLHSRFQQSTTAWPVPFRVSFGRLRDNVPIYARYMSSVLSK